MYVKSANFINKFQIYRQHHFLKKILRDISRDILTTFPTNACNNKHMIALTPTVMILTSSYDFEQIEKKYKPQFLKS